MDCPDIKSKKIKKYLGLCVLKTYSQTPNHLFLKLAQLLLKSWGVEEAGIWRRCKIDLLNGKLAFNHSSVCFNCIIV